jgi:hypothetical protein
MPKPLEWMTRCNRSTYSIVNLTAPTRRSIKPYVQTLRCAQNNILNRWMIVIRTQGFLVESVGSVGSVESFSLFLLDKIPEDIKKYPVIAVANGVINA